MTPQSTQSNTMPTRVEVWETFLVELMVKLDSLHSKFDQLSDFLDKPDSTVHPLPDDDVDSTVHPLPDDDVGDRRPDAPSPYMKKMLQPEKETLMSVGELAKERCDLIRKHWNIVVDGEDVPPPLASFSEMCFPEPILKALKAKGIVELMVKLDSLHSKFDQLSDFLDKPDSTVHPLPDDDVGDRRPDAPSPYMKKMLQPEKETLMSVGELAKERCDLIRKHWNIVVDGEDVPPPLASFSEMCFPEPILKALKAKGIVQPTPIQVQGLPVTISGRDMIVVASRGSGKTLVFVLPLVMMASQTERMMPILSNEGPIGLIICPSGELAQQIYEVVQGFLTPMREAGYPAIRSLLCIDGVGIRSQLETLNRGVHIVVATPRRLMDILKLKRMNLDHSRYLTLDEADRLVGFDDDIREVFNHFKGQHQTLLCSATLPTQILNLAEGALRKPVTVNTGTAGAANLSVPQKVVLVQEEAKLAFLLECLQKTVPPALIYCVDGAGVDDILYYLLLKGVEAVGIHAGIDQTEREYAISSFKAGKQDVLVATDVVSRGLYFPDVEHVISYDIPAHVEDYVQRIGRTGRWGKKAIETVFKIKNHSETTHASSDGNLS